MWQRLRRLVLGGRRPRRERSVRVVAGMATMPSRAGTFDRALSSIIGQVDRLHLYLDGHHEVPERVRKDARIVPTLSRDVPGLHANGKLLGLALEPETCFFASVDDDFEYAPDFVDRLIEGLEQYNLRAIVGLHGTLLREPLQRYNASRVGIPYTSRPREDRRVHALGTGAVMFRSEHLRFDVRDWRQRNMVDLCLAIEAAKAGLPLICLGRRRRYLAPLAEQQVDSIHAALLRDDTKQTELARELLRLCGRVSPPIEV